MRTVYVNHVAGNLRRAATERDVAGWILDASELLYGDPRALEVAIRLCAAWTGARNTVSLTVRTADLETLEHHGLIRNDASQIQSVTLLFQP